MLIIGLVLLILGAIGLLINEFSSKHIIFGVSIPLPLIQHTSIRQIKSWYIRCYVTIVIPTLLIGFYVASLKELYLLPFVILWLVELFTLFSMANKKTLGIKVNLRREYKDSTVTETRRSAVLWDERKLRRHLNLSFIPNWVLIGVFISISVAFYQYIPNEIPMHFDSGGNITRMAQKTWLNVMLLPAISILLTAMVQFLMRFNLSAKKKLDKLSPEEDAERLYIAKERLNLFLSCLMLLMTCLYAFMSFYSYQWITQDPMLMVYVPGAFTVLVLIGIFVFALTTGFSGDRLKPLSSDDKIIFEDDDNYWIMGMFYNNPNDPAIFVQKRFGGGFTVNFGTTGGKLTMIGILLLIAVIIGISIFSG